MGMWNTQHNVLLTRPLLGEKNSCSRQRVWVLCEHTNWKVDVSFKSSRNSVKDHNCCFCVLCELVIVNPKNREQSEIKKSRPNQQHIQGRYLFSNWDHLTDLLCVNMEQSAHRCFPIRFFFFSIVCSVKEASQDTKLLKDVSSLHFCWQFSFSGALVGPELSR